jgi:hypothetical protein
VLGVGDITLQGARGRASHVTFETTLETVLCEAPTGRAGLAMMAATLAVGCGLWRHQDGSRGHGLRSGAALGLAVGSIATLIVTAPLASGAVDGPRA